MDPLKVSSYFLCNINYITLSLSSRDCVTEGIEVLGPLHLTQRALKFPKWPFTLF